MLEGIESTWGLDPREKEVINKLNPA